MKYTLFDADILLNANDIVAEEDGWLSSSRDPFFLLGLKDNLKSGWYKITLNMQTGAQAFPKVYFDLGRGFNEFDSVGLRHISQTEFSAVVKLGEVPHQIRLDPLDVVGKFKIKSCTAVRFTSAQFALFAASRGARLIMQDPIGNFKRVKSVWMSLLSKESFRSINPVAQTEQNRTPYDEWMANFDYQSSRHKNAKLFEIETLAVQPKISVLMPVYNTPARLLNEAIQSVVDQLYSNWELCICNDRSTAKHIKPLLDKWVKADARIKVIHRKKNGHISKASNSALTLVTSEWVALLDHDDVLREHALAEVAIAINENPDCQIVYSDEDKIDEVGNRTDPYFKCEFSPELFRSMNYLNHLTVHRTDNIIKTGAWKHKFVGSQDYDLILRVWERIRDCQIIHIPKVLYHWRAIEGSTALDGGEKDYTVDAGVTALNEHLERTNANAIAEVIPGLLHFRVRHCIPEDAPLVSLIIPTKDRIDLVKACIDSIYEKTIYPNFEIILINNNSELQESFDYFKELEESGRARVFTYNIPFNYSAINNYAVTKAKGKIIGLINNDIEVISKGWLSELVSWAQNDDIGCVGAKLYFENGQIQHGGVIVGLGGVAGHAHKYFPRDAHGYYHRAKVVQNLSAVTAACLLVKKSIFEEVGGLNEKDLIIAFNDVDFCLKVQEAGYRNVWTPFAEMYHYESISRGAEDNPEKMARFNREKDYMQKRWAEILNNDPYYSPNLTKDKEDFSIRT